MTKKNDGITRRQLFTSIGGVGAATLLGSALGGRRAEAAPTKKDETLPQVPRRVLGKTGKKIPILVFGGAVSLDPRFDPKLAEALRFGVNYIDAADCYGGGTCEPAVAKFHTRAKVRDDIWITSKSDKHDPAGFEQTLETSLRKLETNRVELYYLHALRDPDYLNKDLEKTVARLKKSGKMLHFGFSCHHGNVAELLHKAAETPWVESVMFRYNFRQYGNSELNKAIDAAAKAGVGLIAMKTQGSEASFRDAWRKFQKDGKWNKHQAVLKAVWEDKRITAAVSHMDTLDKLRQNIAAALDKDKLSQAEHEALDRYAAATRTYACDGCDHICGARVDAPVQIGDTMRYVMYHDVYGETDKAKSLFRALPQAAQKLSRVDFSGARAACPNGVDVVAHMRRASELFEA
ncbi:aldo/keto reductase [Haliangium sp.]|uniref:aldo/keto reductase n=1 Tax=Haliangium sp. TaxID=2663208 RepID=UPI003D12BFDA